MDKTWFIRVGILVLVAAIGIFLALQTRKINIDVNQIPVSEGIVAEETIHQVEEVEEKEYPKKDRNPEHVAEVLGSQENYEKLYNSQLRVRTNYPMSISCDYEYDPNSPSGKKTYWVGLAMMGRIKYLDIEQRMITISNEGDEETFYVPDYTRVIMIDGDIVGLEELEEGDNLSSLSVYFRQGEIPEARTIYLGMMGFSKELP